MTIKDYKQNPDVGILGNTVYAGGLQNVRTLINSATAKIPFARVCSYEDGENGRITLGGESDVVGLSMRQVLVGGGSTESEWDTETYVPILTDGYLWCELATGSANAEHGKAVYYVHATGEIRADEDQTDGSLTSVLANASFDSAGTAGELVKVKI